MSHLHGGTIPSIRHVALLQELPKDTPIERPWIAEMYAIALGAAQAGVHHRTYSNAVMHPPGAAAALNQEGKSSSLFPRLPLGTEAHVLTLNGMDFSFLFSPSYELL